MRWLLAARGAQVLEHNAGAFVAGVSGTFWIPREASQNRCSASPFVRSMLRHALRRVSAGSHSTSSKPHTWPALAAALLASGGALAAAEAPARPEPPPAPGSGGALPTLSRAEVAAHNGKGGSMWVTYKEGVYDISDFLANHPGGVEKISLAAGGSVDAYWQLYPQHYTSQAAQAALATRRVGTLAPEEAAPKLAAEDPYRRDPPPSPALKLHARAPATAEPPLPLLTHAWVTPAGLWYIRSHHPVPDAGLAAEADPMAADAHGVAVSVEGGQPLQLTVGELKRRFPRREAVVTTQCGGNRRAEMAALRPATGIAWDGGAISTAAWGGASLAAVLAAAAGLTPAEAAERAADQWAGWHCVFAGADGMQASVPAWRVLSPRSDALLAYEMNGEALPAHHGAPLRAVVPGVVGVRSVKWVTSVRLQREEAEGPWQRGMAYKAFPPGLTSVTGIDLSALPSVQEQPITSVIALPQPGATVAADAGAVPLTGYAYSGGGRRVERVDVSCDGGATWTTATITAGGEQPSGRAWAWVLWEAALPLPPAAKAGDVLQLRVKAVDEAGNGQPEGVAGIWNLRGLNCNAYHGVDVTVGPAEQ